MFHTRCGIRANGKEKSETGQTRKETGEGKEGKEGREDVGWVFARVFLSKIRRAGARRSRRFTVRAGRGGVVEETGAGGVGGYLGRVWVAGREHGFLTRAIRTA